MPHLVLASASPRRKELLEKLNIPFIICAPQVDETIQGSLSPADVVQTLSLRKAKAAATTHPGLPVIGSDTVVVSDGKILGKPSSRKEAKDMLFGLSGSTHSVFTGVAIIHGEKIETFYEKTDVTFWELSEPEIDRYLNSGEPFDKAGAYGIQGLGAIFVKSINGDYYSVVGLPISRLARKLADMGINTLS